MLPAVAAAPPLHPPKYLVLHLDINDTVIAGDGAKGLSATQALQIAASKRVPTSSGVPLYRFLERRHPDLQKHELEAAVLRVLYSEDPEHPAEGVEPTVVDWVLQTAEQLAEGCLPVPINGGQATVLLFRTFVSLLEELQSSPAFARALVVFRTNGSDMADLLQALRAVGALREESRQWRGYGEFEYRHSALPEVVVTSHPAVDKVDPKWLFQTCRENRPIFRPELLLSESDLPPPRGVPLRHLRPNAPRLSLGGLRQHLIRLLAESQGGGGEELPKVQFLGLRDVFFVWQRMNRYHGKPLTLHPGATGLTPQDPLEIFIDDNAYEEQEKGRPGPYIVTVYVPSPEDPEGYVVAPVEETYSAVIRPSRERYTTPGYYPSLILRAAAADGSTLPPRPPSPV